VFLEGKLDVASVTGVFGNTGHDQFCKRRVDIVEIDALDVRIREIAKMNFIENTRLRKMNFEKARKHTKSHKKDNCNRIASRQPQGRRFAERECETMH
jgi:hypothetical protein